MSAAVIDRRSLLRAALLLAAGGTLPGCAARSATGAARPGAVLAAVGDRTAAAGFGAAWLRLHPQEGSAVALLDAIAAAAPDLAQAGDAFAALAAAVRADYIHARCELVDDWLLSRTEARLYALATLDPQESAR